MTHKPLLLAALLYGCAIDPSREPEPDVADTRQALDNCAGATGVTGVACGIQAILDGANVGVKLYNEITNPVTTLQKLLQFLGILPTPPTVTQQFAALTAHIDQLAGSLSWQMSETDRENMIASSIADVIGAGEWLDQTNDQPLPADSATAQDSLSMVTQAEKPIAFERLYSTAVFDSQWSSIIPDRPTQSNGFVYDWRMGVPALVEAIAMRLQVVVAENPSFKSSPAFQTEINGHRSALLAQIPSMLGGVRCGVKTLWINSSGYGQAKFTSYVRCADINTGAYQAQDFTWPAIDMSDCLGLIDVQPCIDRHAAAVQQQKSGTIWAAQQPMIIQLQRLMPLFGMHATADMLYMDTHPTQPELTVQYHRISISANTSLCIDVPGASFTNGNAVQLYTCNGTVAQQWVYDRSAQTIKNTTYNKCLDVRGGDPTPGATVQIYDCNGTDAQRWSFDASTGAVENGLGNVLTAVGTIASGAHIEAWGAGVTTNQKWYADGPPIIIQR